MQKNSNLLQTSKSKFFIVDVLVITLALFAFEAVAFIKLKHPSLLQFLMHDNSDILGAEYDCIARAIRWGRGFSDPFCEETGSTAWMPPVFCYFLASSYWLTSDNRPAVVEICRATYLVGLFITGMVVLHQARQYRLQTAGFAIFTVVCSSNFHELFQKAGDTGILLIAVNLLWLKTITLPKQNIKMIDMVMWGALGGFLRFAAQLLVGSGSL